MKIGVVILNYCSFKDTIKLVVDLQKQTALLFMEIVIVDNDSPNDSFDKLQILNKKYNNVKIIKTEKNIGYAKGNNFGLRYLEKLLNIEYVAIINNDVKLPHDCFDNLLKRYLVLKSPAIIAPTMLYENGDRRPPFKLNNFLDDCISLFILLNKLSKLNKQKEFDNTGKAAMQVDLIPGSFMFTRLKTFKEIGYFYPNTFLYNEEMFIAFNVKQLGLKNYIALDLTYIHAHNSPTISEFHSINSKYSLLFDGILEYTRVNRKFSKIKILILKILMKIASVEKFIYSKILKIN